jgi:hypothetical protein
LQDTAADEEPLTSSEDEADEAANNSTSPALQQSPSMVKTQLQLGRKSFNRTAPNIFELSRNSSLLDSLQDTLPSPQHCSSGSLLFSPRISATQIAQLDSLSAAAALTRTISLRHTPTLAQLPTKVQDVLEQCGALFIEDGNIEGLAGEQQLALTLLYAHEQFCQSVCLHSPCLATCLFARAFPLCLSKHMHMLLVTSW